MTKKIIRFLLFLLFCSFFPIPAFAVQPISIEDAMDTKHIGKHIEYIEDGLKKLNINKILTKKLEWKQSDKNSLTFGFTSSVYWFRFSVENSLNYDKEWFLEIDYPMIDRIDLFIPGESGDFTVKSSGDHRRFYEREIIDRNFFFRLNEKPGLHTYYFRIETTSSLNFSPAIYSQESLIKRMSNEYAVFWIYYGFMIALAFYNLFLVFSIRESSYFYLIQFTVSYILFQLTLNGFAFQYIWPNHIWWANNCLPFFMGFTIFWGGLFFRAYMNTAKNFPLINKIIIYATIIPNGLWSIISLSGNYVLNIQVATGITLYSVVLLYLIAGIACFRGSRSARFIITGFSVLLIGTLLFTLKTFGILPSNFITRWSIQIGSSIIFFSLSIGLADKINIITNDLVDMNRNLRHTETALRESEKKHRLLAENISDSIWILDIEKLCYTYFSPSIEHILGFTPEELIGTPIDICITPDALKEAMDTLGEELKNDPEKDKDRSRTIEVESYHKNGSTICVEATTKFLRDDTGRPVSVLGVTRDISLRKKAEKELKKAKIDAEAANIAKNNFLANMSHEIRTPLNAITGMTELLTITQSKDKLKEYLSTIRNSSKALLKLFNDILYFSKFEMGKLKLDKIPFSISNVIGEVSDMFHEQIHEKNIKLIIDIPSGFHTQVIADPVQLRQVFVHLLSNAVKFTTSGEIHISTHIQSQNADSVELLFCVKDTGIGISENLISTGEIFDAFTQADSSTTRKFGGTGLGLTLCKKIIDMMNGEIWAESIPNQGSSFFFKIVLPLFKKKSPAIIEAFSDDSSDNLAENEKQDFTDSNHPVSRYKLIHLTRKLDQSIREFDPIETNICIKKLNQTITNLDLNSEMEHLVNEIEHHVENYRFDDAGSTLDRLISELNTTHN